MYLKYFIYFLIFCLPQFVVAQQRFRIYSEARVSGFIDYQNLVALSEEAGFVQGEILGVRSKDFNQGFVGFVEVTRVHLRDDGLREVECRLLRQSKSKFIQVGDRLFQLNLFTEDPLYVGTTDLIVRKSEDPISARYKPLFTQGPTVGETAQTLWKNESILTFYGLYYYGFSDRMTAGLFIPNLFFESFNWTTKYKVFESDSNIASVGLTYIKIPNENKSTLNMNFYWDSVGSESTLSHTFFSLALLTWDGAIDTSAIKSAGTTSLQTGYEFILNNWDRVLVGPSYNFEKKSVGGYVSYLQTWDKFHFQWGLGSTNISQLTSNPRDGYYLLFDAYWRF